MYPNQAKTGWEIALDSHLSSVTPGHRQVLSSDTTPEDIVAILERARQKGKASKINKLLDAVTRATAPLREFQAAIDVVVQVNAEMGYRDEIEKTVAAVSLLYVQDVKHITTELRETGIVQWRSEQRAKTLKWLSPIEIEQDNTTISKQWVQGTSEWILQTTKYTQWFEGQSEHEPLQILWLRGGVGSGKTFLAHFIAQTLTSTNCNVLQYYFSAKQELGIRRTQLSFIRTILYQALVNTSLDTTSTLEALNRIREISGKSEAQSPKKLWSELFRLVQGQAHTPIYLVIDAIDEAIQDERDEIFKALEKLISLSPSVRIFITGRPDEDVLGWFEMSSGVSSAAKPISEIRISHEAMTHDIEIYINSRIQRSNKLRHPSVVEDVKCVILSRAEGMFLYVRLMLDELECETSVATLRRRLDAFPATLNEYYESTFSQIYNRPKSSRELARDLLTWVANSYEPLHIDTVLVALKSQHLSRTVADKGLVKPDDEDEFELLDPVKEIRSICFPLLEVTESGIVQVVHCSVAAYIHATGKSIRNSQYSTLLLTPSQANQEISLACIYFLRLDRNWPTSDGRETPSVTPDPSSLFLEYSTKYWPEHMSESSQDILIQMPLLFATLSVKQKWFLNWVTRRSDLDYRFRKALRLDEDSVPSCFEIAAYFGITAWAVSLLQENLENASLSRPSLIAATRGSLDVLRLFHQRACADGTWNAQNDHLLHATARNGHPSVARFLIAEAKCDVNSVDSFGRSALMHASSRGHTAVVCELLRLGADTSLVSCAGYSAAEDAAAAGDIRSLKTLLAGSEGSVTGKCLLLSSANGHVAIVEFLLQHTALDPSSTDENSWTPLHWACRNGHAEVVKALLSRGANIDARDNIGRTPLNRAVRIGSFDIAQKLLKAGASPVSCDSSGVSLTHFAAAGGYNEVLGLLLAAGVDPNTGAFPRVFPETTWQHGYDSTPSGPPLHLAAENGHLATIRYLLSHGAEVDKKGPRRETALHKACDAGQEGAVRILLEANANDRLQSEDFKYPVPLVLATKNLHIGIISMLAPIAWSRLDPSASDSKDNLIQVTRSPIESAIRIAVENDSLEGLVALFSHAPQKLQASEYVSLRAFEGVLRSGNVAAAEFIAGLGFDLSSFLEEYRKYPTPLGLAVQGQKLQMIQFLLSRKVNPTDFQPTPKLNGYGTYFDPTSRFSSLTALDYALLHGDLEILELLLNRQSQPPDPKDQQSKWDRCVDQTVLLPRLRYFADIRQEMQLESDSRATWRNPWHRIPEPRSPMCIAIAAGDLDLIQKNIDEGVDLNELDWEFETPLIKAIRAGNPEIVARLLNARADIAINSLDGTSVLALAYESSNTEIFRMLLQAGASTKGLSLVKACLSQDLELMKALLDAGVDPNLSNKNLSRMPPLYIVVRSHHGSFFDEALTLLLDAGARAFDDNYRDGTVLHLAADRASVPLIRKFAEMGIPMDICDEEGRTALHRAIISTNKGEEAACLELLRLGASSGQVGDQQISALHVASGTGNHEMVQWLIKRDNRDINAGDANGHTPLMWAIMGDWANSPHRALLNGEYRRYWLSKPRCGTNIETARFLIESGASIDPKDHQQRNVLHWAARMGTADILSILLDCGVDVHAADIDGRTALHLAIMEGAVECVRLLLTAGANPNAIDNAPSGGSSGQLLRRMELDVDNKPCQTPPLLLAFTEPNSERLQEMTQLLLDAGANVFGRNFNGETCLHVAVKEGNITAVEELLCANSYDNLYVGIKDNMGRSARDCAEQLGHTQIAKLLEDAEKGKRPYCRYSRTTVIPLSKDELRAEGKWESELNLYY
ncbi:hypothetical protein IL306_015085 [Fusarium sp. DS 682]|nr:hypothetical protein IL306_015085 [Fusarium sp. DS 682]